MPFGRSGGHGRKSEEQGPPETWGIIGAACLEGGGRRSGVLAGKSCPPTKELTERNKIRYV